MNIDLLKFSDHRNTGIYLENIFSQGFLPLIVKPTRLTSHSATLIDHGPLTRTHLNEVHLKMYLRSYLSSATPITQSSTNALLAKIDLRQS